MSPTVVELNSARLRLRMLRASDVDALFALHSDPRVMRYWSTPAYTDVAQAQALFEKTDRGVRCGEFLYWAITVRGRDQLIGGCTLFSINATHARAEIGYALASDCWGRGYAQEALRAVLDHAFGVLRLHRIEADVDPRNAGSRRLLERLGFKHEGLLRERWRVAGEISDSAIYGLLADDYATAAKASASSRGAGGETAR